MSDEKDDIFLDKIIEEDYSVSKPISKDAWDNAKLFNLGGTEVLLPKDNDYAECYFKNNCTSELKGYRCLNFCRLYPNMSDLIKRAYIDNPTYYFHPDLVAVDSRDVESYNKLVFLKYNAKALVKSGQNVFIYSKNYGNGMTTWAVKILFYYFYSIYEHHMLNCRGVFVHTPTLIDRFTLERYDEDFQKLLTDLRNCDLVIWDDISDFSNNKTILGSPIPNILTKRISEGKSNIYTSHKTFDELGSVYSDYVVGRMQCNCAKVEIFNESLKNGSMFE